MKELSNNFRIKYRTVRRYITYKTCLAIWENMRKIAFIELNENKWIGIANGFNKNANYSNYIDAIDGKHTRVINPSGSASLYYNYKKYFSIVLLAVRDTDCKLTYIDNGAYGKCSNSSIFKHSVFHEKLVNKNLQIPGKKPISNNGIPMSCHNGRRSI